MLRLTLILILFSGNSLTLNPQEKNILTLYSWIKVDSNNHPRETYTFFDNGQYSTELGKVKTHGQWLWTSNNEIFMLHRGLQIDTLSVKFQEGLGSTALGFYIKIVDINEKELVTLERYEGDSWDSGFVRKCRYLAKELVIENKP